MKIKTAYPSQMCKAMSMGPVLIPERVTVQGLKHLCQQVNGKVFLIKDDKSSQKAAELRIAIGFLKGLKSKCDGKEILM